MVCTRTGPPGPELIPAGQASARIRIPTQAALAHAPRPFDVQQFTARLPVIQYARTPHRVRWMDGNRRTDGDGFLDRASSIFV